MRETSPLRFIVYLAYLGAVFVFGGLVYERLTRFEGHIYIEEGGFERVVVQPVARQGVYFGSQRNMPVDVIPFSNAPAARRVFQDDTLYNAQILPFKVRLDKIDLIQTFPDRELLDVIAPDGATHTLELKVGEQLNLAGRPYRVEAIRPWAGLVRNAKGTPMAALSLRANDGGWSREFLLTRSVWTFPDPNTFFLLRWHDTEAAARTDVIKMPVIFASGRWGVEDGPRIHWSTSLLPGAGFTLDDGTVATLVAHDPEIPAIAVEFRKGDAVMVEQRQANQPEPGRVHFDAPGHAAIAFAIYAWRDGMALVQRLHGESPETVELHGGESWQPESGGPAIRLDEVMASALPATPSTTGGDTVTEVVLHGEGGDIQLRQGLHEAYDGLRLRYHREPVPARVRYQLRAQNSEGMVGETILAPEDTHRFDAWVFSQEPRFERPREGALLLARRTLGGPSQMLGMAMVVVGAFGWVALRFYPRRSRPAYVAMTSDPPDEPPAD